MRKFVLPLAALLAIGLAGRFSLAADDKKDDKEKKEKVTGVLIDQMCGEKMLKKDDPQKAAAAHPKSCAVKCADSGYAVMVGKKLIKFDDAGSKKAKEYLDKHDSLKV